MLGLVADTALQSGLGPVVAVIPPDSESYLEALAHSIIQVVQEQPLGTGHAALQARDRLPPKGTVVILSGDVPLIKSDTIQALVEMRADTEAVLTLITSTKTNPEQQREQISHVDILRKRNHHHSSGLQHEEHEGHRRLR